MLCAASHVSAYRIDPQNGALAHVSRSAGGRGTSWPEIVAALRGACDVPLPGGQIATMLAVMLLTSKGAAGVSGSGLVALVATLAVIPDLPLAGVALLVGIDRFMSESRPDERDQQRMRGDLRIDVGRRVRPSAPERRTEPGARA
jgi:hypothetical protein